MNTVKGGPFIYIHSAVLTHEESSQSMQVKCKATHLVIYMNLHCCGSVAQSCPTLCNPMNCSAPGFPVLHHLLKLA